VTVCHKSEMKAWMRGSSPRKTIVECKENFPRTALRECGNPSVSAGHGFPGTNSGTATKFREFAAGEVLLCADWVKIRGSRRRRLR
jgi:hypothetical protein